MAKMTRQLDYDEHGAAICDIWDRRIVSSTAPSDFCFKLPLEPQNPLFKGRQLEMMSDRSLSWQHFTPYTGSSPGVNPQATAHVRYFLERVNIEMERQINNNPRLMSDTEALFQKISSTFDENNTELHRERPEDGRAILRIKKLATSPVLKGLNGEYEIRWYMKNYGLSTRDAAISAVRSYMSGTLMTNFWSDESLHPKLLDACGSLLCVSSLVDHCETPDAERVGGLDVFIGAINDGMEVFNLEIPFIQEVFYDLIASCAYMKVKNSCDFMSRASHSKSGAKELEKLGLQNPENFNRNPNSNCGPSSVFLSPERFLQIRWWGACVSPFTRIVVGFCNIDNVPAHDELGTPYCLTKCPRVFRAMNSVYRYNEVTDMISDFATSETENELLVAFCVGGLEATKGYAEALAEATESVMECPCPVSAEDHMWGAVMSQGYCFWEGLRPRYMLMKTFHDAVNWQYETFGDREISARRGAFLPGANRPVQLQESAVLHTKDWSPLWTFSSKSNSSTSSTRSSSSASEVICGTCEQGASALATRILMQPRKKIEPLHRQVTEIIHKIINPDAVVHTDSRTGQGCVLYDAESYAKIWESICFELYNFGCLNVAPDEERAAAAKNIYERTLAFSKILWRQTGKVQDPTFLDIAINLDKEGEKVWFNTHNAKHYKDGTWRRQLMMGILSSFLELSPMRAFSRACNFYFGTKADYN